MNRAHEITPIEAEPVRGAILVDFENLVFGLAHHHGAASLLETACLAALGQVARELVHPAVRRAYGDWRIRDLNQFQLELYRGGFEIVQVLGRLTSGARKNATDIRLAIDAVELALSEPHLQRFVIVSGDRDMIEIVRCLHRHGREVVVIAPDWSASADLAEVCDRFIPYSKIQRRTGFVPVPHISAAPADECALDGAESAEVEDTDSDAIAHIAAERSARTLAAPRTFLPGQSQLATRARLANYRYEGDPARRRRILRALHDAARARGEFSLADVRKVLAGPESDLAVRPGDLNKCWTVLYQGRAFRQTTQDAITPMQFRPHVLSPDIRDAETIVRIYERCIVYKLIENSRSEPTVQEVRVLLGLQEEDLGWCADLLAEARSSPKPA